MSDALLLVSVAVALTSGVPGLFLARRGSAGERIAAFAIVVSAALGLAGLAVRGAAEGPPVVPWTLAREPLALRVDGLSAMFLAQIFLLAPLGSIYGLGYWPAAEHPEGGRKLRFAYGLVAGGMTLLVCAKSAIVFLFGWEVMAVAAFFAITTDDRDEAVRDAGLVYLVATRVGALFLYAMFVALHAGAGSWAFAAPDHPLSPALANVIFLLAVLGFGLKAGVMPMHVWLPGAHANAPSHVSAIMSGVLIKMGIYGLLRTVSFFEHPPLFWGLALLAMGIVSGVLGIAFAIGQRDLKRVLAYSSVENIGIIFTGIGIFLVGRSVGDTRLVVLGLGGALLHVWNHGLFKGLLFLTAGAVIHGTHTRDIELLGGLARKMPRTSIAFFAGAIAICGLPPLNGFVSELLVYLALFRVTMLDSRVFVAGAFGAAGLALVGALAVACFVRVWGVVFLGAPRSDHGKDAHDPGGAMTLPLVVLGCACAAIGLGAPIVAPVLDRAVLAGAPELAGRTEPVASLAPLGHLPAAGAALVLLVALGGWFVRSRARRPDTTTSVTWDCGYAAPTSRMQYTASSFGDMLVTLFSWALRPERSTARPAGLFPETERFDTHVPAVVLDRLVRPATRRLGRALAWWRWIQHGNVHLYILYILVALLLAVFFR